MPIGTKRYKRDDLTPTQREALYRAARQLADMFFDDLRRLARREVTFAETSMADYLPRKHLGRYDLSFAERFVVCLLTVAWKLRDSSKQWLACTAEELALRAMIEEARTLLLADPELDNAGAEANFNRFESVAFEDWDFEMLFDPAYDGVEDASDPRNDIVNLHFDEWFWPFNDDRVIHPYLDEGQSDKSRILT
jgi:hypothetical protein